MDQEKTSSNDLVKATCEIKLKLPSLNDYVRVCRANKYGASKMKKTIEKDISLFMGWLPKFENPIKIHFHWVEIDMKRDADNIAFAKKFILDTLVKCKKIKDDSRKYVVSFKDTFATGKENKVILYIYERSANDTSTKN